MPVAHQHLNVDQGGDKDKESEEDSDKDKGYLSQWEFRVD